MKVTRQSEAQDMILPGLYNVLTATCQMSTGVALFVLEDSRRPSVIYLLSIERKEVQRLSGDILRSQMMVKVETINLPRDGGTRITFYEGDKVREDRVICVVGKDKHGHKPSPAEAGGNVRPSISS